MTPRTCIATVVTRSHLHMARVLVDSIRVHHPMDELDVLVCVLDGDDTDTPPGAAWIAPHELQPDIDQHARLDEFGRQPVVIAAKACLLRATLARGYDRAVFLDADMVAYDRLDPVIAPTAGDILLTPHVLAPLDAGPFPTGDTGREFERILLLSGVFNGGCIAVNAGAEAGRFLAWLCDRLATHCRHDVANGLHYDQTWLDLVPGMFDRVHILRDASVNVAYWNLAERPVELGADDAWLAAGQPLRLFHFSGFDPARPDVPSRHRPAMPMSAVEGAEPLYADYARRLHAAAAL